MRELTRYKVKPIECWAKMKELRRKHFRHIWQAHEQGHLITIGMSEAFLALPAGLGDYAASSYGPYFTGIMRDRSYAVKVQEVAEARGFGKDVCCSMRVHMGQVFMGLTTKSPLTGEKVIPDFIFQPNFCANAGKTAHYLSEYLGIPILVIDIPTSDSQSNHQYLFDQLMAAIEWLETITGRTFDDERFIQATQNEWECMTLWARICLLTQHIPAPIDARHLISLRQMVFSSRHEAETVSFYRELLAEVEDRVREGISARGFEVARLSLDTSAPFFYPNLYRYPEKYGAIVVVCEEAVDPMGVWELTPQGHWTVPGTPRERGIELRTREDAVWSQVELECRYHRTSSLYNVLDHIQEPVTRCRDWHCDGIVFHSPRGCRATDAHLVQAKLLADREGIPNTLLEGSHADPRDFDQVRVHDRIDAFLESLGLTRIV